jgi:hypothetical protein
MLAQFQSLYPNGSLISELVEIFQGKYIVRASVQVEGVTRATGMAGAETVEAAEDQARNRALMVLGITSEAGEPKPISSVPIADSDTKDEVFISNQESSFTSPSVKELRIDMSSKSKSDTYSPEITQFFPVTPNQDSQFDLPEENIQLMGMAASNVTPFTPRNYTTQEETATPTGTGRKKKKSEPVDLSDILAKTDVQIERLGWTPEQGKDYLVKTYGKRGRTLLNEEELLDFLKYLQSQPDPLAGF